MLPVSTFESAPATAAWPSTKRYKGLLHTKNYIRGQHLEPLWFALSRFGLHGANKDVPKGEYPEVKKRPGGDIEMVMALPIKSKADRIQNFSEVREVQVGKVGRRCPIERREMGRLDC